jgi:uncharacterized protein (TIGR03437 family)
MKSGMWMRVLIFAASMKKFQLRKSHWILFLALFSLVPLASAAPVITGGPVNAASYTLNGLPNSGIAQGGMFILFGTAMGPPQLLQVSSFPIQTQLGGTSIQVTVGATTVDCLMLYTLDRQVAAILPSNTPIGDGTVRVRFNNEDSNTVAIRVVQRAFGVFARNQAGSGPSIIQNFNSEADQPVNSILEAATPGQIGILWGTGLGPVAGDEAAGPLPGDIPNLPIEILVGGQQATVTYRGRSGCCAGIDQIVFTVPQGVQGCYVDVAVLIGGVMSNSTTMAIAPERGPCTDPIRLNATDITQIQGGGHLNLAELELFRITAKIAIAGEGTLEGILDEAEAGFQRVSAADMLASVGIQGFPSLGSCSVQQFQYQGFFDSIFESQNPIPQQNIDAGPTLSVTGPQGTKQIPKTSPQDVGSYEASLGGIDPDNLESEPLPEYLVPGMYTFNNGAGGAVVGPFNTQMTLPSNMVWNNRDTLPGVIPRNQPLVVTWSGADSGMEYVFVVGSSASPASGSGASFACAVNANLGSFSVPVRVLGALPPSGQSAEGPVGFLIVGKAPLRSGSSATITNVQIAYQYYLFLHVINTNYQ